MHSTPNEVYLWQLSLEDYKAKLADFHAFLSPSEQQALLRRTDPYRRDMFLLGHGLLHRFLAHHHAQAMVVEHTPQGKWYAPGSPWHFSLSHSCERLSLAATMAGQIGVDVEFMGARRNWPSLIKRCFQPEEVMHYRALPVDQRNAYAYRQWSYKEAWLKAHGLGVYSMQQVPYQDDGVWSHQEEMEQCYTTSLVVMTQSPLVVKKTMGLSGALT